MLTKVKISLRDVAIELEGSEEFVERQIDNIESLMGLFENLGETKNPSDASKDEDKQPEIPDQDPSHSPSPAAGLSVPASFGELMHKFKDDINDQQKALIAAFYVQSKSNSNDFKTSEVSNCLKDHGIKIANPSTSIQRLATKKQTFQTRKVGKLIYMRVSKDGEAHLRSLLR